MAYPVNHTLDEIEAWAYLADVSTGTPAAFTYAPIRGEIVRVKAVQYATIAGTDCTVVPKINGTAITGGTITLETTGDAAGDTTEVTISPGSTARVAEGDTISFVSGGECDNATVPCMFTATIRARRN